MHDGAAVGTIGTQVNGHVRLHQQRQRRCCINKRNAKGAEGPAEASGITSQPPLLPATVNTIPVVHTFIPVDNVRVRTLAHARTAARPAPSPAPSARMPHTPTCSFGAKRRVWKDVDVSCSFVQMVTRTRHFIFFVSLCPQADLGRCISLAIIMFFRDTFFFATVCTTSPTVQK